LRPPSTAWRLVVLPAIGALGLGGCHLGPLAPVGSSAPRAPDRTASTPADTGDAGTSAVPSDFRSTFTRATDRFLSRGHGERFDAVVWINATARSALQAEGAMEDGSLLLEETTVHDARGERPTGLLVMEKRQGTWSFTCVGPEGEVVTDPHLALCVTCHREAPQSVFPLIH
jgi:hypothetical protein